MLLVSLLDVAIFFHCVLCLLCPGARGIPSSGTELQECNEHKPCPKEKYCRLFQCDDCKKENALCTNQGQCCEGECQYGRCKANASAGQPGTFCDTHKDCRPEGTSDCCIREPAINPHISICKPLLEENMVCGPINFFKTAHKKCGPCKEGLECKQVGIFGVHEICVRDED